MISEVYAIHLEELRESEVVEYVDHYYLKVSTWRCY